MEKICSVTSESLNELIELAAKAGEGTGVCPVETAYLIADKAIQQSCGKGVMCRDGLRQIWLILEDITNGRGKNEDIELLQEICGIIKECADCELSEVTVTQVEKLLNEHMEDFELHIKRKSCKNLICPGCHTVHIDAAKCTGSGECIKVCPADAIKGGAGLFSVINQSKCTACNKCIDVCAAGAIKGAGAVKPQGPTEPAAVGSFGAAAGGEGGGRRRRRG